MELIAHRAGNESEALRRAEEVADAIELDVHLGRRGRVEARHGKRVWPTHRLWERWHLLPRDTQVPALSDLVDRARPTTVLWADLKGFTPRLSRRTKRAFGARRPLMVSTKAWWLLGAFTGLEGVRTLRSAGNRLELFLLRLPIGDAADGTVVHHRLLHDEHVISRLKRRGLLYTWAVDDLGSIERLADLGVDGVILDDLSLIGPARALLS